jgi:hypothetical protein
MRMWCGRAGHMLDSGEPGPVGLAVQVIASDVKLRLELYSALVASL